MDKDRVIGSAKQVKDAVKQAVGKAVGDTKLESEGKADKIEGKVQNESAASKIRSKGNSVPAAQSSRGGATVWNRPSHGRQDDEVHGAAGLRAHKAAGQAEA